jgi:hypothetical protein
MRYDTLQSSASIPAFVTGGWLAKQSPERQLAALVAAAARQTTITHPTHKQLAAMAGMSVPQFREARRQHGAPIRPRKRRVPVALPTPAIPSATVVPASASPAIPPVPVKLPTAQQVADLIATLRSIGSGHLFNAALIAEHDEQIARPLNGAASHTS